MMVHRACMTDRVGLRTPTLASMELHMNAERSKAREEGPTWWRSRMPVLTSTEGGVLLKQGGSKGGSTTGGRGMGGTTMLMAGTSAEAPSKGTESCAERIANEGAAGGAGGDGGAGGSKGGAGGIGGGGEGEGGDKVVETTVTEETERARVEMMTELTEAMGSMMAGGTKAAKEPASEPTREVGIDVGGSSPSAGSWSYAAFPPPTPPPVPPAKVVGPVRTKPVVRRKASCRKAFSSAASSAKSPPG